MWRAETIRARLVSVAAISLALAVPAAAQDADQASKRPTVSRNAPPSSNSTVNLINLLVKQGVLGEEQAATLVKQADDEAYVARQAVRDAAAKADGAEKRASTAADAVSPPGTKRVTYVPEIVKQQLRDEIKRDVMAKAEKENWASPGKYPEWAQRIRFYGDVRTRYEGDIFPPAETVPLQNYNAINTGSAVPGGQHQCGQSLFSSHLQHDPGPQSFPLPRPARSRCRSVRRVYRGHAYRDRREQFSGVDQPDVRRQRRKFLEVRALARSRLRQVSALAGSRRFGRTVRQPVLVIRPIWSGTGTSASMASPYRPSAKSAEGFTPFFVAGAFPVFNTDLNAGLNTAISTDPVKLPSRDKWLFGGQVGFGARFDPETQLKSCALPITTSPMCRDACPAHASFSPPVISATPICSGRRLRRRATPICGCATFRESFITCRDPTLNYQYYGLASAVPPAGHQRPARSRAVPSDTRCPRRRIRLEHGLQSSGGFRRGGQQLRPDGQPAVPGPFNGGNKGWLARLTVGHKEVRHLWDWNAHVGYKYLESDAMIDAFVDSDFGLGGTNLKGYFIGGNLGLGENVWATVRWMSANSIAGLPYAVDIVQLDLNARF